MGQFLKIAGVMIAVVGSGIIGGLLTFGLAIETFGMFIGVIIFFGLYPLFVSLAPLYQGVVEGDWTLLLVIYPPAIVGAALFRIGYALDDS